jgi:hypothetical protein
MFFKYSTDLHQVPVEVPVPVAKWDWIAVGAIKGFAFEASETVDGMERAVVTFKAGVDEAPIFADAAVAVAEGDYLVWDPALNLGNGAFTNDGATQANHDAIAGYGVAVPMGTDDVGLVWLGLFR